MVKKKLEGTGPKVDSSEKKNGSDLFVEGVKKIKNELKKKFFNVLSKYEQENNVVFYANDSNKTTKELLAQDLIDLI